MLNGSSPLRRIGPQWPRLRAPSPFDVAVAIPVVLTFGVLTYAASVLIVSAGHDLEVPRAQAAAPASAPDQPRRFETPPALEKKAESTGSLSTGPAGDLLAGAVELRPSANPKDQSYVGGPEYSQLAESPPVEMRTSAHALVRDLHIPDHARAVQRRLAELGHFSGAPTGLWGPVSRAALRSFKEANGLPSDATWDAATEEALFRPSAAPAEPFVGRWVTDLKACSPKANKGGYLPTVIESNRARAGETSCEFKDKRQAGERWQMIADCAAPGQRWTARIQLMVRRDQLTWTSERGSQGYLRCPNQVEVAHAGR